MNIFISIIKVFAPAKRATIQRHLPTFCSEHKKEILKFKDVDELFNIDFVDRFSNNVSEHVFYGFSISRNEKPHLLMAEYDEGKKWFVVGYLNGEEDILRDLPDWEIRS